MRGKVKTVVKKGSNLPQMPGHFSKDRKYSAAWKEMEGLLSKKRVLTMADSVALEMLTDALVSYRAVEADLRVNGYTHKTKNGYEQIRPCVTMCNLRGKQLRGLLEQFGMTPVSRQKASRADDDTKDPLDAFMER